MQYFVVNAFTNTPFTGNPATVVFVPPAMLRDVSERSQSLLFQRLARELSHVETAFVLAPDHAPSAVVGSGGNSAAASCDYRVRFFTANTETSFCGHAVLAAAYVLQHEYRAPQDTFYFSTKSGVVQTKRVGNGAVELLLRPTLPVCVTTQLGGKPSRWVWDGLVEALIANSTSQAEQRYLRQTQPTSILIHESSQNLILAFEQNAAAVSFVSPDPLLLISAVKQLALPWSVKKVTLTATPKKSEPSSNPTPAKERGDSDPIATRREAQFQQYDMVTRLFAPWIGIAEDAASGATHAILAKYWQQTDARIRNLESIACCQPSARSGQMQLRLYGEREVGVGGEAVIISSGVARGQGKL